MSTGDSPRTQPAQRLARILHGALVPSPATGRSFLVRQAVRAGMGLSLLVSLLVAAPACRSGATKGKPKPGASARVAPAASSVAPAQRVLSASVATTFESKDGIPLAGDLQLAPDPTAPLLLLVHRFRGKRSEWSTLYERLRGVEKRYHVLALDLRGHGESRSSGKSKVDWATLKDDDVPSFVLDLHAAAAHGLERAGGKARGVVVIGDSLGAALVAQFAREEARVVALGAVSPGAAIMGYDIYRRFAEVRELPSFVAWASADNVSRMVGDALGRMARDYGTTRSFPGGAHGVARLGADHPELWEDLLSWLDRVWELRPTQRSVIEATPPKGVAARGSKRGAKAAKR